MPAPWTLTQSYRDSAPRLYRAALAVKGTDDPATAGHLFGTSAESAVKAHLENELTITIGRNTEFWGHFPKLKDAILASPATRHMKSLLVVLQDSFLDGFTIETRYASDGCIDQSRCDAWQANTESLLRACGTET